MKVCIKCNTEKPVSEFYRNKARKDGYQSRCKKCASEYLKEHYSKDKQYYIDAAKKSRYNLIDWYKDYKATLKCQLCPEYEPECLDFHHIDPNEKEFTISAIARHSNGKQRIIDEIAKCVVLCSNCHRKVHAGKLFLGP